MNKKNIALLAGGNSGEAEISYKSAIIIEQNIDESLYNVYKISLHHTDWYYTDAEGKHYPIDKNDFSLTINKTKIKFHCVFIAIHGTPGEDGMLQGYFELIDIPYTTCDHTTSAITFNKSYCNKIVQAAGINIANSIHLFQNQPYTIQHILDEITLPCFVKPNNGGSSIGMSKVNHSKDLEIAIQKAFHEDNQVLIEEFIEGKELTCGMINANGSLLVFPITQIIPENEYFDYEAKYKGKSKEVTPAEIDETIANKVKSTAAYLYNKLNCKGIVRFDFILKNNTDDLYFLEVNTVPGQSAESIVPQQIRAMGLTIKEIYTMLIEESMKR
ncbi:MAG: D-alanine--D-alanine ligase [Bacteroidetes bacterium]|nr:D-alanine--D-alanine ligase [Bacteroidota bacterium]